MPHEEAPWWLEYEFIGFEDPPEDTDETEDPDADEEHEDEDEDEDLDDEAKAKKKAAEDNEGLKSALRKERQARRAAEKENRLLKKGTQEKDEKDTKDVAAANERAAAEAAKSEKLAAKLLDTAVNTIIIAEATKLGFADVDDAIALIDRSELDVEQDEDDPSEVDVDKDSVKDALKKLVKSKPHLLRVTEEGGNGSSGARMGGRRDGKKGDLDDEELYDLYPALRQGRPKK